MSGGASTERHLRAVLTAANVLGFEQDADLHYRWIFDPTGRLPERAIVRHADDAVFDTPAEAARIAALKRGVIETRSPTSTWTMFSWGSGQRVCRVAVEPVLDDAGAADGVAGTIRPTRRDDDSLKAVLDGLHAIGDSPSAYIYVKDLDGRYVLASPLVSETAGQEVIGKTDFDLFPAELAAASSRDEDAVVASRQPAEAEETRGEQTYRIVRVPILAADGRPMAICGVATDITDYALLVERLFAVQRTEIVGQLASTIAHDFNNLLSVVTGHASLALERVEDTAVRSDIEAIQAAVAHGWNLSHQLLQFANRRPRARPSQGLSEAVLGVLRLLGQTMPSDIDVETRFDAGDVVVAGDDAQHEQIVMNLVLNARDAMPDGGSLVIRTELVRGANTREEIRRQVRPDVSYVCICVSDTGEGMPRDVLARAVSPFFTTKPPGHGTGLGLATVQGIVKELRGGLAIESTEHQGTTVRVYLPLTAAPASTASIAPFPDVVLVVAEDDAIREQVTHVLTRAGHVALPSTNCDEALAILQASDGLDLAVVDADVPGCDAEFAGVLRRHLSGGRMLFLSSSPESAEGLEQLLRKPFTARELVRAAREALSSGTSRRRFTRDNAGEASITLEDDLRTDR